MYVCVTITALFSKLYFRIGIRLFQNIYGDNQKKM